jgi:hypothetical protein
MFGRPRPSLNALDPVYEQRRPRLVKTNTNDRPLRSSPIQTHTCILMKKKCHSDHTRSGCQRSSKNTYRRANTKTACGKYHICVARSACMLANFLHNKHRLGIRLLWFWGDIRDARVVSGEALENYGLRQQSPVASAFPRIRWTLGEDAHTELFLQRVPALIPRRMPDL